MILQDLTDLISSLARDQAIEVELPVTSLPAPPGMPDVSTAISNILNFEKDAKNETTSNATPTSNILQKKRLARVKDYEIAK